LATKVATVILIASKRQTGLVRNPMTRKNPPINSVPFEIYAKNNEKGMLISLSQSAKLCNLSGWIKDLPK
jgi:hypothetical protein